MTPLISTPANPLRGRMRVPGDKSISHRALMLGAVAVGPTVIHGLLESEDVLRTADAVRALGAGLAREPDGAWRVDGVGVGGLAEPERVLDMGNSGTGLRLLMGLVATHPFTAHFGGDESLSQRPMDRVARPLVRMGARVVMRENGFLPLSVTGTDTPVPITYRLPVPSAQVKSAVLLAGLNTPGETTVIEPAPTRDHTEILLRHFGADVAVAEAHEGPGAPARRITITGQPELAGRPVTVPGDPSSAAFAVVAALIVPGSEITVEGVGVNPLRMGLYETLMEMGADITFAHARSEAGEPVADITVRAGPLEAREVPAARAPRMIDEYPALAVAAAFARGRTVMRGLSELRVKESDRVAAIARGLSACGVRVAAEGDSLAVEGAGGPPPGGARTAARGDHRIAMAFLVLGCGTRAPVTVDDTAMIDTSFPGFAGVMNALGAGIAPAPEHGAAS